MWPWFRSTIRTRPSPKPFDFYLAPGVVHAGAGPRPSTCPTATTTSPSRSSRWRAIRDHEGQVDLRPEAVQARRGPQGTTAYTAIKTVVAPTAPIWVSSTNDAAIQALKAKQIDGIVDGPSHGVLHHGGAELD